MALIEYVLHELLAYAGNSFFIIRKDLIMNNEERNSIEELPIDVIDQFPKHPYKVKDDDDMLQLIESIKENGVIQRRSIDAKKSQNVILSLPFNSIIPHGEPQVKMRI